MSTKYSHHCLHLLNAGIDCKLTQWQCGCGTKAGIWNVSHLRRVIFPDRSCEYTTSVPDHMNSNYLHNDDRSYIYIYQGSYIHVRSFRRGTKTCLKKVKI